MKRNKCVYEYRLPESEGGHTYYVGQGNYNRPYKPHPYRGHKRNPCIKPKDKNQIVIIKDNLTEQEAKDLEIKLIAKHGRIDLGEGYLINKTDGGEGTNGYIVSEETRKKMSETNLKNMLLITCIHCGLTGKGSSMYRWHNDNCKHKNAGKLPI